MNYFLAKTDPETYSIFDLEKDDETLLNPGNQEIRFLYTTPKENLR